MFLDSPSPRVATTVPSPRVVTAAPNPLRLPLSLTPLTSYLTHVSHPTGQDPECHSPYLQVPAPPELVSTTASQQQRPLTPPSSPWAMRACAKPSLCLLENLQTLLTSVLPSRKLTALPPSLSWIQLGGIPRASPTATRPPLQSHMGHIILC
jgi:hypothetical protein